MYKTTNRLKQLGWSLLTSLVVFFCSVSHGFASGGLASLYAQYSPEKQFPTEANCHTPRSIDGKQPEPLDISAYLEQRKAAATKRGYTRSEHRYEIPEVPLVTMNGNKTTLNAELNSDKPVMLNFIFTTCTTICPVLSATFYQLQNELGEESREISMISISIDPEFDTPQKLKTYAERFNAGPQWQFLTGDNNDIVAIEQAFDAFRGAKMNHDPLTFIKAKNSDSWVRITGIASAEEILNEYRQIASN